MHHHHPHNVPNTIHLPSQEMRSFYRKCKEDLEWYMNHVNKEDYYFIFKPVGPPSNAPFIQLEGEMAEELMKHIALFFGNKMRQSDEKRF